MNFRTPSISAMIATSIFWDVISQGAINSIAGLKANLCLKK